jgi:hypothetical protein
MKKICKQKRGRRNFRNILSRVATQNADRLMGRARLANKLAKSLRGRSRRKAYAVKSETLLELTRRFPERIRIVHDFASPRFVLVQAPRDRFGLHAPAILFEAA